MCKLWVDAATATASSTGLCHRSCRTPQTGPSSSERSSRRDGAGPQDSVPMCGGQILQAKQCSACTSLVDGFNQAIQIAQRVILKFFANSSDISEKSSCEKQKPALIHHPRRGFEGAQRRMIPQHAPTRLPQILTVATCEPESITFEVRNYSSRLSHLARLRGHGRSMASRAARTSFQKAGDGSTRWLSATNCIAASGVTPVRLLTAIAAMVGERLSPAPQ